MKKMLCSAFVALSVMLFLVAPVWADRGADPREEMAQRGFAFHEPVALIVNYDVANVNVGDVDQLWLATGQQFQRAAQQRGIALVVPTNRSMAERWAMYATNKQPLSEGIRFRYVLRVFVSLAPNARRLDDSARSDGASYHTTKEERGVSVRVTGDIIDCVSHVAVGWVGGGQGIASEIRRPVYNRTEEQVGDRYGDFVRQQAGSNVYIPSRAREQTSERQQSADLSQQVRDELAKIAGQLLDTAGSLPAETRVQLEKMQPFKVRTWMLEGRDPKGAITATLIGAGWVTPGMQLLLPVTNANGRYACHAKVVGVVEDPATGERHVKVRYTVPVFGGKPVTGASFDFSEPLSCQR